LKRFELVLHRFICTTQSPESSVLSQQRWIRYNFIVAILRREGLVQLGLVSLHTGTAAVAAAVVAAATTAVTSTMATIASIFGRVFRRLEAATT
jgi:hypothetical protein